MIMTISRKTCIAAAIALLCSLTAGAQGLPKSNATVCDTTRSENTLRVLYWNIQNGMWVDQGNNYDKFVEWVREYDPDICVWVEAATFYRTDSVERITKEEKYLPDGWPEVAARYGHNYTAVAGTIHPQVVTSKYPIETVEYMRNTEDPKRPIRHGVAIQSVNVNGEEIYLVPLHFWPYAYDIDVENSPKEMQDSSAAEFGGERFYRLHEIEYICEHTVNNPKYASVQNWLMLGDFNSISPLDSWHYGLPDDAPVFLTQSYLRDSTSLVDVIANRFPDQFVASSLSGRRIDYVHASKAMYDRIDKAMTLTDDWTFGYRIDGMLNFCYPSDHFPLLVDFRLNQRYGNPVIKKSLPDPTVLRAEDGNFYLFATEDTRNVPIYKSSDLVSWEFLGTAFTAETHPTLIEGGMIWAPDINFINGKYVLYYCMSKWGGIQDNGIGVAVADRPEGPYTDLGGLIMAEETGVQNSIDQFYWEEEDGSKWMFWGSFRGIYAIQLSDDGLSVKEGAVKHRVAGSLTEGTCVYKRGGYYYLIGSAGSCCNGANATYHLVVARSENLLGPYVDTAGLPAQANHLPEMLHRTAAGIGPGPCSEILTDDAGQTWLVYHGYQTVDPKAGRITYLDQVLWDSEGWPYMTTDRPTYIWDKPVIGSKPEYTYSDVDYIECLGRQKRDPEFGKPVPGPEGQRDPNRPNVGMKNQAAFDALPLYDTGYVPKENTRIDVNCRSYAKDAAGNPSDGQTRTVFSAGSNKSDGYALSVYFSANRKELSGRNWSYYGGGYINENLAPHEYDTDYQISLTRNGLTVNGEEYAADTSAYSGTHNRLVLFSGFSGEPYCGRIYSLQVYEGDALVHDYRPCLRNEDGTPVFHDTVTGAYILPSDPKAFSCGTK